LTGDASNVAAISHLSHPARVSGFARFAVKHCDYPAIIKKNDQESVVEGYLLLLESTSQRKRLDKFEGELYRPIAVEVRLLNAEGELQGELIEADVYFWNGDMDELSSQP
jgi:hypothetical protein